MKDIILFHGSRGGIDGKIRPISRVRCNFGQGFYLGTDAQQAKSIVIDDDSPYFYTVKLKLSEIPEDRVLNLSNDKDWLYTILANRKRVPEFNDLSISQEYLNKCKNYDVIIGSIADDRMTDAMSRFANYGLTDAGLIACLKTIKYGTQYVIKTQFACNKIEVLDEKPIYGMELDQLRDYTVQKRRECRNIVNDMAKKYQRTGLFLNEIIDQERDLERDVYDDYE